MGCVRKSQTGIRRLQSGLTNPFGVQLPPLSFARRLYPSVDLGGVFEFEFYVSPLWMAHFDAGDTIRRYGEIHFPGLAAILHSAKRDAPQSSSLIGNRFSFLTINSTSRAWPMLRVANVNEPSRLSSDVAVSQTRSLKV